MTGRRVPRARGWSSGPSVTTVSSPAWRCDAARSASTACDGCGSRSRRCRPMSPMPSWPCTCCAVLRGSTIGRYDPPYTGTSERPHRSRVYSAFCTPCSSGTLPATTPMPTTSMSGCRSAMTSATASSDAVSVSMKNGRRLLMRASIVPLLGRAGATLAHHLRPGHSDSGPATASRRWRCTRSTRTLRPNSAHSSCTRPPFTNASSSRRSGPR